MKTADQTDILQLKLNSMDQMQLFGKLERLIDYKRFALINYLNVHGYNLACSEPDFCNIMNSSEVVFCDGFGVKLGAWILGKKIGPRMTPPDWIDDLFELCLKRGYSLYFLGDTKEVVFLFAETVKRKYPGLKVVGFHDGFFTKARELSRQVMDEIKRLGPDIILTGMGMPLQEKWAWEAKQQLDKGVIIATGALFRWYSGYERRAPRWITDLGLEWATRLVKSPVKHFRRYVIGIPIFFFRILQQRFRQNSG
jgi:N-acetylglucosaminyldiphosphoundecaprenol N-acetyl-beta-D-mannosaminyltransferase